MGRASSIWHSGSTLELSLETIGGVGLYKELGYTGQDGLSKVGTGFVGVGSDHMIYRYIYLGFGCRSRRTCIGFTKGSARDC